MSTHHTNYHRHEYGNIDRESGYEFEERFLYGDPARRAMAKRLRNAQLEYRDLQSSLLSTIDGGNPLAYSAEESWMPQSESIDKIHQGICRRLGIKDFRNLRFFPSIRTAADRFHQIDFWIAYHDEETGKDIIVTVDITKNPDKEPRLQENKGRGQPAFEADMLLTENGAFPHPIRLRSLKAKLLRPLGEDASSQDISLHQASTFDAQAQMIANIIEQKLLQPVDTKYGTNGISIVARMNLFQLLNEADARAKEAARKKYQ